MNKNAQSQMVLHENLWSVMIRLSWPAVAAMVLYGLNTVFDALFVGRFVGETALAGVSLAYPLAQLSLGLGQLIGVGAGSALSIAIGAKDIQRQQKLLGNVTFLNLLIGLVTSLLGILFAVPLIQMMGGSGEELIPGAEYFRITLYAAVFWIAGLAGNMIVRAEGKMGSAALMMGLGLVVNVFCNYLFIVVFGWGVKGAAWGTNIAMVVYTLSFFI
jgi:Na+-driven multidrug efflux pump